VSTFGNCCLVREDFSVIFDAIVMLSLSFVSIMRFFSHDSILPLVKVIE